MPAKTQPDPDHVGRSRFGALLHSRPVLLFAFAVMADPVSSVAYATGRP